MSSKTWPPGRGTAMMSGLLPMVGVVAPQAGRLARVLVQQIANRPWLGGLQAVAAAAHPVVRVGEGDAAHAVLLCEGNGSLHGDAGVEVADSTMTVPAFDRSEARGLRRFGVDVDAAVGDRFGEAGKPVEPMGVDAIARRLGEEPRAVSGTVV